MSYTVEKFVPSKLKEGMILAQDIYIDKIKLLSSATCLTSRMIQKITELQPFSEISVYKTFDGQELIGGNSQKFLDSEYDKFLSYTEKRRIKAVKMENTLTDLSKEMKRIFMQISMDNRVEIKEIRKFSKNILENFPSYDYDILIKNLIYSRNVDEYLFRHSLNVGILSAMIGKWMKFNERDLLLLTYSAVLHDVGKSKIDEKILNKPGKLTSKEFNEMKKHPIYGYNIVKDVGYLDSSVSIGVLMHHERLDGSGYPLGVKEEKIHQFAKIIAVADTFDAMTSNRCYEEKKSAFYSLEEMQGKNWRKLDGNCCAIFLKNICDIYTGEHVKLNNGQIGKIISMDMFNITRPLLLINDEFIDLKDRKDLYVEDLI